MSFANNSVSIFFFYLKLVSKSLDLVREQGAIRFKSAAYTAVREHFESDRNAAIGQEMKVLKPVLGKLGYLSQDSRSSQP